MKIPNILKLLIAIVISELAGIIGSLFTASSVRDWYTTLVRPDFAPPSWVFAPVWTTLFALMGIAAFLVWKKGLDRKDVKIALGIFIGQLVLNTLWSILFFGMQNPGLAFVEIIILWLAILATIISFGKIRKVAAWLLIPYILWVSFASVLNFSFWQLNKSPQPKELISDVVYSCANEKQIAAKFFQGPEVSVRAGEMPRPSGSVELAFEDRDFLTLSQTISGSGVRYANKDESIVFWSKGDSAFMTENGVETYSNCEISN